MSASAANRWQEPRIYLTIVAVYFIGSGAVFSVLPFFWLMSSDSANGGGIGWVFGLAMLFIGMIYAIIAALCAYSLLKTKPHFALSTLVLLLSVGVAGSLAAANVPEAFDACTSGYSSGCEYYYSTLAIYGILITVVSCMIVLLLAGRKRYLKSVEMA